MHSNQIAAYIDRTLDEASTAAVEAHLAECAECRAELVGAHRTVHPRSRRRPVVVWSLFAAAAAAVLFIVVPSDPGSDQTSVLRGDGEALSAMQRIEAVQPASGATIAPDDRTFIWQSVAQGANYRMTVTRVDGSRVWVQETADTIVTAPDSVRWSPGNTYLWVVDAMLADGSQAKTEVRSFTIVR